MSFSSSLVPQTGVRHSTFESLHLGRSSQSIAVGLLRFWDSLNFEKDNEFMDITVAMCSSMYTITDHPFLIRFIPPTIIDEVITGAPEINLIRLCGWEIRSVQGSDLTKETTRVVIRLLIDP
ncbi:hypothetical protein F2Q69_00021553 [Brassica cretica]|uniref:DUF223 domain-containing protein n=1 Tax=Brassica cretica TaxID=69181 RepID=A0A8S9Q5W7_BRACR|nr:hypothetical protein F2Q69_00021553 [Brassica cretica]